MRPRVPLNGVGAKRRTGFTLIEVLVSVIILSIGMLGIAGLQAATSRYKMNSWARNAAAVLVSDFADRVRANSSEAGSAYSKAPTASSYVLQQTWADQATVPDAPTVDCQAPGVSCTPAQRATYDLTIWRRELRRVMPTGSAWIEGSRAAGINVTLMWTDQTNVQVGASAGDLVETPRCSVAPTSGVAQTRCCPDAAEVEPGVRCLRFSFIP